MKKNIVIVILLIICASTIVYSYKQGENQKRTANRAIETADSLRVELTKMKDATDRENLKAQQLLLAAQDQAEQMKANSK